MRFHREDMPEAHFDLTPMIDVVLLLIIFFTLTAQFADTLKTPLDLPAEKGAGTPEKTSASVVVDMTRSGELRLQAAPIGLSEFLQVIARDMKSASGSGQPFDLTVRVDRGCAATHLNGLASALTQLGVRNWKIATASETEGGAG